MYQSSYEQLYSQNQALGTNNVSNNVSNNFAFRNKGTSSPYLDPMRRLVQSTWQNLESAGIWVPGLVCEVHPKLTSIRRALLTMGGAIPGQGILDCAEGGGSWAQLFALFLTVGETWLRLRSHAWTLSWDSFPFKLCWARLFYHINEEEKEDAPHNVFAYLQRFRAFPVVYRLQTTISISFWLGSLHHLLKSCTPSPPLCLNVSSTVLWQTDMLSSGNNVRAIEFCTEAEGHNPPSLLKVPLLSCL